MASIVVWTVVGTSPHYHWWQDNDWPGLQSSHKTAHVHSPATSQVCISLHEARFSQQTDFYWTFAQVISQRLKKHRFIGYALSHSEKNATDNLLCTYRVGNISSCDKAGRIGSRQRDNADRFNKEDWLFKYQLNIFALISLAWMLEQIITNNAVL